MLGQPVWLLKATMPQDEFLKWISYLNNKPPSIQEQQMAVLSTMVSNALGGKAKVKDFLLSKTKDSKVPTNDVDAIRRAFGVTKKKP